MTEMIPLLERLTPLNRVVCSRDFDTTLELLKRELPFKVIKLSGSSEHNGWQIPPKWDVIEATISKNGKVLYDGKDHALGVIALSSHFEGKVSLETLRRHLHFDHRHDDSLTFHFRQLFRPWDRTWGFVVPRNFYEALEPGDYDIAIRTQESPGYVTVLDYTIPGELDDTIVVAATPDHPGVSNDGLSGVVAAIELFKRLSDRTRRLTLRLVLAPSTIGTEYFLANLPSSEKNRMLEVLCLFMTGSKTPLALQRSKGRKSLIEMVMEDELASRRNNYRVGEFREININDDYIWESHGIPATALSRFPYPEYHSSRDNLSIIDEASLAEVVDICEASIDKLDNVRLIRKLFTGTVCLSNPKYDLYIDPGQISFGESVDAHQRNMRRLMDEIPTTEGRTTNLHIASACGLELATVDEYLDRWAEKHLLEIR